MSQKIQVLISHNEKPKANEKKECRATKLAKVIMEDGRFELPEFQDINVDLQFISPISYKEITYLGDMKPTYVPVEDKKIFNVELKEPPDYVSSVLGNNGHAAMQWLDMAEAGQNGMFLVLGSDADVSQAIKDSLTTRYRGSELAFQIASYEKRLIHFESLCAGLGSPVERWKAMPYTRLLSRVHTILTGKKDITAYGPRPEDHMRELFAANCLFRGLGHETLTNVLEHYKVSLTPRHPNPIPVCDLPGVGKKRAALLEERIVEVYGGMI